MKQFLGKWEKLANQIAIVENFHLNYFAVSASENCVEFCKDGIDIFFFCKHTTKDAAFKGLCKKYFSKTKTCKSVIEMKLAIIGEES